MKRQAVFKLFMNFLRKYRLAGRQSVWILENSPGYQKIYRSELQNLVNLDIFSTAQQIRDCFRDTNRFWPDLIVVDEIDHGIFAEGFVIDILNAGYQGILVAASDLSIGNDLLVNAGCDLRIVDQKDGVYSDKLDVVRIIKEQLML